MSVLLGPGASPLSGPNGSPSVNPSLNGNLGKVAPAPILIGSDDLESYTAALPLAGQGPWVDARNSDLFRENALATSNLKAYYRYDDSVVGAFTDASPAGVDGVTVNTPGLGAPSLIAVDPDASMQFFGPGGPGFPYATVVNASQIVDPAQGSIFYRVAAELAAGQHCMQICIGEGTDGFHVKVAPGNDAMEVLVFNATVSMTVNVGAASLVDLANHSVGLRWTGVTWDFFFDGVLVATTVLAAGMGSIVGKDIYFMAQDIGPLPLTGGTLDEMIFSGDPQPDSWFMGLHGLAVNTPTALAVVVDAGSLVDGVNSAACDAQASTNPGIYGDQMLFPTGALPVPFLVRSRALLGAAPAAGSGDLMAFGLTSGIVSTTDYAARAGIGVYVTLRNVGGFVNVVAYDRTNQTGQIHVTAVAVGTPVAISVEVVAGNVYNLYVNDVLTTITGPYLDMATGAVMVTLGQIVTVGSDLPPTILATDLAWDTFQWFFESTVVAGPTSVFYDGEASTTIATSGFASFGIQVTGPAFDATGSVAVRISNDGINWALLTTIVGNAGHSAMVIVYVGGALGVDLQVSLPADVTHQGVVIGLAAL
jgi:hypothetical protein